MIAKGTWWVTSKKDPRWSGSGRGYVGGLVSPPAAEAYIEEKKKELGKPPDDLEVGYMKF